MFRNWGFQRIGLILLLLMTECVMGCVKGSVRPEVLRNELPSDLAADMKNRFDVQDHSAGVEPASVTKKTKAKKKKNEKVPFAYPSRRPEKEPFTVGEELEYTITYLGIPAGSLVLDILPFKTVGGRKSYHIHAHAKSSAVFSVFYRLNDTVESFIDYEGIFSHRFHLVLDESKQTRDALELYDHEKGQTFFWNRWNHKVNGYKETKEFSPMTAFSQDSVSALYYLRTIPLPEKVTVNFSVVSEGKTWEALCTVIRKEMMDSPLGKVQALVIEPDTKFQGVLKKNGNSFLWLSDDERRIPLRLEAKVRIGSVVAQLTRAEFGKQLADMPAPEASAAPTPLPNPTQ